MGADVTEPHIGRIYDYLLGGTFNHEVDRRAAEAMVARMPAYPRWARSNRSFLGRAGKRWAAQGRTAVLDLGSGLPTQGHLDASLPDARILFADIDPLTVAQGREILAGAPGRAYVQADLRAPDPLLAQAAAFFGNEPELAVGCIGVVYFLSDDEVRLLMQRLHAFCAPGSTMALSFPALPEGQLTDEVKEVIRELSRIARIAFFHRTADEIAALVAPWRIEAIQKLDAPLPPHAPSSSPMDAFAVYGAFAQHDGAAG
jgi:O-methyltransferase involved in polyketide biosynthesis